MRKRENNKFEILETMQFDSLFLAFPPKNQEKLFNSYIKMSVTHINMQIIKKQLYFTVLSNERDWIKTLEKGGFRTKKRDHQKI